MDERPTNCRFRLQEEGQPYPRSSCQACGLGVLSGLGTSCHFVKNENLEEKLEALNNEILKCKQKVDFLLMKVNDINKEMQEYTFQINRIKRLKKESSR